MSAGRYPPMHWVYFEVVEARILVHLQRADPGESPTEALLQVLEEQKLGPTRNEEKK